MRAVFYGIGAIAGLAYPFGPVDLIPDRLPVIGYLDQAVFVGLGLAAGWLLLFGRAAVAVAPDGAAALPVWAPGRDVRRAGWRDFRTAWPRRLRLLLLDGFGQLFAAPLLRLAIGRWPTAAEIRGFRHAFRRFAPVPPLLRALASVPAARHQLMRTMLITWLLADESYQGEMRAALGSASGLDGDRLEVWLGPKVTFLHLEKTAGLSVVAVLAARFHPMQIDPDPRRTYPPHVLSPLPPYLIERVRRFALVWGHYDLPSVRRLGDDRFLLTMLREPRARIVSLYRYWRSVAAQDVGWNGTNQAVLAAQRLSLAGFLRCDDPAVVNYIDNFYVRRLTGTYFWGCDEDRLTADPQCIQQQALDALAAFDFIGLTEDTDGALTALGGLLGFTPPDRAPRANVTRLPPSDFAREEATPEVVAALDRLTRLDAVVYAAVRAKSEG